LSSLIILRWTCTTPLLRRPPLSTLSKNVKLAKGRRGKQAPLAVPPSDEENSASEGDEEASESRPGDNAELDDDEDELDDEEDELDSDDDELDADGDELDSDAICLTVPKRDNDGLIRVGPQPVKVYEILRTTSREEAENKLKDRVANIFSEGDSKFLDKAEVRPTQKGVISAVLSGLTSAGGNAVQVFCDYTGRDMSWAPGPYSISIEAIYPVALVNGKVGYHTPANVCRIMTSLNWIKNHHPPLALPLVGQFLRTHKEDDFEVRKSERLWTYTAIFNVGLMRVIGLINGSHITRVERWQGWPAEKQAAILEHLRTGVFGPFLQERIDK
jgi:hypothetical protein